MGTHPIFESDFDCLTELKKQSCRILKRPLPSQPPPSHPRATPSRLPSRRHSSTPSTVMVLLAVSTRPSALLSVAHQIPILKIGDNKTLGEWSGLCKIDREGTA